MQIICRIAQPTIATAVPEQPLIIALKTSIREAQALGPKWICNPPPPSRSQICWYMLCETRPPPPPPL